MRQANDQQKMSGTGVLHRWRGLSNSRPSVLSVPAEFSYPIVILSTYADLIVQ